MGRLIHVFTERICTLIRKSPSGHMTFIRRLNVDAKSWRCIDFEATLYQRHVPAGVVLWLIFFSWASNWIPVYSSVLQMCNGSGSLIPLAHLTINSYGPLHVKTSLDMRWQWWPRSACTSMETDQCFHCLLPEYHWILQNVWMETGVYNCTNWAMTLKMTYRRIVPYHWLAGFSSDWY